MFFENKQPQAFTLIEIMVVLVISVVVMYGIYIVLFTSSDAYQVLSTKIELQMETQKILNTIRKELKETELSSLVGSDGWKATNPGAELVFSDNQALAFCSARDTSGTFQINEDDDYTPNWQAVVVYAPYTKNGLQQLRRYQIFGSYDSPVEIRKVSLGDIIMKDASGSEVNINRNNGSPGSCAVLLNNFSKITLIGGNPLTIKVDNEKTTRNGRTIKLTLSTSIAIRY